MNRLNQRQGARKWRALALVAALALVSQSAVPVAGSAGTETDAPAGRAAANDSLVESLVGYFFGPAPVQQPAQQPAQQTAQPQATPSPTPEPAQDQSGTNAPAGEGDAAPPAARRTIRDLKYPLPPWGPLGAAGPESTVETLDSVDEEFVPMPDRWRFPWPPSYDRYDPKKGTPWVSGSTFDPYNQNVLKADYPIAGNHTFLNLNLQSQSTLNPRTVAAGGRRDQFFVNQNFIAGLEIFRGTGAFEPKRWAFRVTTVTNFNFLANNSLNPFNARRGRARIAVEEAFVERRLLVHSPNFDFVSLRVGMQNLTTDFRGFLFSENQLGLRLFGNANANRDQYNIAVFSMRQRDDTSQLHSFDDRRQTVFAANWFRQDFVKRGYTILFNFHHNADRGRQVGDRADLNVSYLGFHGDGKLGRLNVSHAFYQAFGRDRRNRLTGVRESVNGQMGAFEAAVDRDWVRWRGSFFFASGDGDARDGRARGFDVIQDNPNFAGGPFMFWTQQATAIGGRIGTLKNKFSLIPTLRNKFDQRANFVNPGVLLWNFGADLRVTPKLRMTTNLSYVRFAQTGALEQLTGRASLGSGVGTDLSVGAKFRPFQNENLFIVPGVSVMFPHGGYAQLIGSTRPLVSPTFAFQAAF